MGIIRVRDLTTEVRLGVLPEERRSPQIIQLDLDVWTDMREAARRDSLDAALNYVTIAEAVRRACAEDCHLLEALASRVVGAVQGLPGVTRTLVRVRKRHLPGMGTVGYVEVELGSEER